ncbi:MAG: hypothetical protein IPI85_14760 [Dehalococcoidia bacterium]|nr:hypothetical protein [Dehalococcoidia bacterium]
MSDAAPVHHPHIKEGATIEHVLAMTAGGSPEANTYRYTSGPILEQPAEHPLAGDRQVSCEVLR